MTSPRCPQVDCVDEYLVGYEFDQETKTHTGQLRCAVCNRHTNAPTEQITQADAADAQWFALQVGVVVP